MYYIPLNILTISTFNSVCVYLGKNATGFVKYNPNINALCTQKFCQFNFLFVLTINVYIFLEIYIVNGLIVQDMTCAFFM